MYVYARNVCLCKCVSIMYTHSRAFSLSADDFARSCPQTEMERLKARYLKEKSPYVSQSSILSSTDVSSVYQLERSQNYHSLDSDEDEDVSLYFDSFSDLSLDKLSPSSSSRVLQPSTSSYNGRDCFTDSTHLKPGLHHKYPSGGAYHPGSFELMCVCAFISCVVLRIYIDSHTLFCWNVCIHRCFCSIMSSD